jgi:phage terminase large subunit
MASPTLITIEYQPRKWAERFHNSTKRWFVLVLHRRAGKTTAVLNHLQRDCLRVRESQYAYIGPTYKQSKRVAWDIAKRISRDIPGVEYNESELTVKYPNGSKLILVGSDNPDSLRGLALWGVGFDEYSQQPSNIFTEIISKALADHLGYAIFFGTPKGKNEFYRLYEAGKSDPDWEVIFRTIDDSLRDETGQTIDNLRIALEDDRKLVAQGVMTQDEFDQEWYCSFNAAIQGAYYAKELDQARKDNRITSVPHEKLLQVHTWWDLGVGDSTAIGFFQIYGNQWRMIDYYEASGEGLQHYINVLREKGYQYGEHFAPHDIRVRELGSGKSRLEISQELGLEFSIAPNMAVEDGINAVRMRFNTLWIDQDKCKRFLEAISQYRKEWNDKMGEYKDHPLHDWTSHAADMLRYWAVTNYQGEMSLDRERQLEQIRERKAINHAR